MCFFVRVMVTGSWPARRNSICMPTKPALGSSPSSMLWSSNSYASDTHHLASLITQDSLQVLPLNLCQHRRDGTQPRERRLPLYGVVEIKFQVTNCRQPWFTHQRSRIGSEIRSNRPGIPTALSPPECSRCGSKLTYLMPRDLGVRQCRGGGGGRANANAPGTANRIASAKSSQVVISSALACST